MGNKIYVGNLPFKVRNDDLKDIFASYGEVTDAMVIQDRQTRRSKGFGFVTFDSDEAAQKAVSEMNGKEVQGRALKVSEAKEREEQ